MKLDEMNYRQELLRSLGQVVLLTLEKQDLELMTQDRNSITLEEWKRTAPYPDLVKYINKVSPQPPRGELLGDYLDTDVLYISGGKEARWELILDGSILYEKLLYEGLTAFNDNYHYSITHLPRSTWNIGPPEEWGSVFSGEDSSLKIFLPRIIDTYDFKMMKNPISRIWEDDFREDRKSIRKDPLPQGEREGSYVLTLSSVGGYVDFMEKKLLWGNIGLIMTAGFVLALSYGLLFKLFRDEERYRQMEQTFVASISHELRTPIAVIKSASDNLTRGIIDSPEKVGSYGNVILGEANRLNRMVESILYYSRLEAGGTASPQKENVNPGVFTGEILKSLELSLPGLNVIKELDGTPHEVLIDKSAYRQILENLVTNGYLYGSGNPLKIFLKREIPSRWSLVVEDRGKGIPRREQKRIFDPFIRGKERGSDQIRGSGLGLHLVKTALNGMGGSLTLESPYESPVGVERTGCRFTLYFPIEKGRKNG